METRPLYISLFLIIVVAIIITPIINTFAGDEPPSHIPIGTEFMSVLIGNELNIFVEEDETDYNFDLITDYDFLYNFTSEFPNYAEMDELKDGVTGEQIVFLEEIVTINGNEVPIFKQSLEYLAWADREKYVVPQPSTLTDSFKCAFNSRCKSVENFKFVDVTVYENWFVRVLRTINPYRLLLPETFRNNIDTYLISFGYLPQTISEPLMLIIVIGFTLTNILLTIKLLSLVPFIGN